MRQLLLSRLEKVLKRVIKFILAPAALLLMVTIGYDYFSHQIEPYPFRCSTFTHYDLSRKEGKRMDFSVTQDLRFENKDSGYLLLNGQAISGSETMVINRRIVLSSGNKTDYDTYRYAISEIVTSATDNTPDSLFTMLLSELTLDPSYLQLDVDKIDKHSYLIGGPLSYLFTCQRY